jgi:hypothetical protein
MPKQRLDLTAFRDGALPAADQLDVGPQQAAYAENIDLATRPGILRPLPDNKSVATNQTDIGPYGAVFTFDDALWLYDGSEDQWVYFSLPNGSRAVFANENDRVETRQPRLGHSSSVGDSVRIPQTGDTVPAWLGAIDVQHPHAAVLGDVPTPYMTQAPLRAPKQKNVGLSNVSGSGTDGNFTDGTRYHFFASWLYDGYQEGPLADMETKFDATDESKVDVDVTWTQGLVDRSPARAQALLLYAQPDPQSNDTPPEDLPVHFIKRLDAGDDAWSSVQSSSGSGTDVIESDAWGDTDWTLSGTEYDQSGYDNQPVDLTETKDATAGALAPNTIQSITLDVSIDVGFGNGGTGTGNGSVTVNLVGGGSDTFSISKSSSGTYTGTASLSGLSASGTDTFEVTLNSDPDLSGNGTTTVSVEVTSITVEIASSSGRFQTTRTVTWKGSIGNTYADRTGIARTTAEDQIENYAYSLSAGPYHVVSGASVDQKVGDGRTFNAQSFVLRSKAYRPDMFDWANDFVNVEQDVRGLAAHRRSVAVFCESDTFILNRNEWRVIDHLRNVTAFGPRAATSTPQGLVFCDGNGVYLWRRGDGYRNLTTPIEETDTGVPQYSGEVTASTFQQMEYLPAVDLLTIVSDQGKWAYYMPTPTDTELRARPHWVYLTDQVLDYDDFGGIVAHEGTSYVVYERQSNIQISVQISALFEGVGYVTDWTWRSAAFAPGGATRLWAAYLLFVQPDAFDGSVRYREDAGPWQTASPDPRQSGAWVINTSASSPPWTKIQKLQVEVSGGQTDRVRALGITYRPMTAGADDATGSL